MILMGQGMGILIEMWKITKAVDIKIVPANPGSFIPYRVEVHGIKSQSSPMFFLSSLSSDSADKHVLSEDEKKTQQ